MCHNERTTKSFIVNGVLPMVTQAQTSELVYYAPHQVTLEGVVKVLTFAGRPNYESIANGDEPRLSLTLCDFETCRMLAFLSFKRFQEASFHPLFVQI